MRRRDVIAAYRLGSDVEQRLAARFLRAKIRTYRDALAEISDHYGDERKRPQISPAVRAALEAEANAHARSVVSTMNRLLRNEARRRPTLSPTELAEHLGAYMAERGRVRAPLIGENEVATARVDAFLAFMADNGVEPRFEFAGPPAKCPTCQILKRENPHPHAVVVEVGRPHIGCRHWWRPKWPPRSKLPARLRFGRSVGPIIGADPITMREGGQVAAVAEIERLIDEHS